ncbi:hypothetical protein CK510_01930 [Brunnivagina elsteri CCALA 953]|uniref:Uncharacterized protein n=1 Tax=Brunnivagina elsteri CCALA 953 TaxID=987040 RepID=A0A2A2TPH8_9CYAN|nr:hypothetical protein CK510_01930 [Calothrix elsteri CCALA 953]
MYAVNGFSMIAKSYASAICKGRKTNFIYPSGKAASPETNVAFKTNRDNVLVRKNIRVFQSFNQNKYL